MNVDEARYVLVICEQGSLTRAAESLHISPQGLSLSLKRFEAKLGVKLFTRSSRGMQPTEHAERLRETFEHMVSAENEMYAYLAGLKQESRARYLIGRDSMLGDTVAQGVEDYNKTHPDGIVQAVMMREPEDRLAHIFLEGGYSYRVLSSETDDLENLAHAEIGVLRFVPLVNCQNAAAQRGSLTFGDLREYIVLAEYRTFVWVRILEQHCEKLGFTPRIREMDKDYSAYLLREAGNNVIYVRELDLERSPWNAPDYCVPAAHDPLEAHIILQSIDGDIDEELVACLRERFAESPYAARG